MTTTPASDGPAGTSATAVAPQRSGEDRCEMCSHAMNKHDGIATRYCAATQMNALARNCICPR